VSLSAPYPLRLEFQGTSPDVSALTSIREFPLALWLVTHGRRITLSEPGSHAALIGAAR
jgi:hypothetical protein